MAPLEETTINVLLWIFVSCGFICCIVCTLALLQKGYNKYVLRLPEPEPEPELFQNIGRYAKATVSVILPAFAEVNLLESNEEDSSIIAVQIV